MAQLIKPIVLKNPGCDYCRYYLAPFSFKGGRTRPACLKGAQKIFQQDLPFMERRKWKWIDCAYATEKNKDRKCPDFRVYSITRRLLSRLVLLAQRAGTQLPPSFAREIWWKN